MKRAMLLAAGAGLLLAGAAVAQDAKPQRGRMADADGDGRISQAEMVQAERMMFSRLDTDRDGKVTPAEIQAMKTKRLDGRFARLDTNGDGSISKAEFSAAHEGRGARGGKGAGMLARLDGDGDGTVTQAEADAKAQARFAAMDKNKDGFVTSDERPSKMGRHSRHGRGGESR